VVVEVWRREVGGEGGMTYAGGASKLYLSGMWEKQRNTGAGSLRVRNIQPIRRA
jgi:hypothetical protein